MRAARGQGFALLWKGSAKVGVAARGQIQVGANQQNATVDFDSVWQAILDGCSAAKVGVAINIQIGWRCRKRRQGVLGTGKVNDLGILGCDGDRIKRRGS